MEKIIKDVNGSIDSLKLWLYASYLNAVKRDKKTGYFFLPEENETYPDKVSKFTLSTLKSLKGVATRFYNIKHFNKPEEEVELKKDFIYRGETFIANFAPFKIFRDVDGIEIPQLLKIVESISIEDLVIPKSTPLPDIYYEHLKNKYKAVGHIFSTPFDAYYEFYGGHYINITFKSYLGDLFKQNYLINDIEENGGVFEMNISYFGGYHKLLIQFITQKLLIRKTLMTFFIVYKDDSESTAYKNNPFFKNDEKIKEGKRLLIVSNDKNFKLSLDDIEDILITLGLSFDMENITPPIITPFEKAALIGRRAQGLANNDPMILKNVPNTTIDLIEIAELELKSKLLPIDLIRRMPNGDEEKYDPNKLTLID